MATSITETVIDGCSFEGSICSKKEGADVGGLIGFVWRSSDSDHRLRNCFVRLTKIDGYKANSMGGITGKTDGYMFENSCAIIDSFAGTMNTDCSKNRGAIVGYLGTDSWNDLIGSYAVVKSITGEPVWRMANTTSGSVFHNYSYAPEGVFMEDSISQATDLTETLMKAAAGSGTGDNEPLVDRLNNYASETSSRYKTWYNGTDGYLCFTIPSYTITFDGGTKGTGNQEAESCNLGESVTLPGVVYKNMDYVQKGWATSDGGTKAYDLGASISPTENMTLYPYWEAKPVATYTAPTGLTAIYGDILSDISLPDGFTWNAPETSVGNAGTHTFTATYTPTDETYGRDTNVQISVEVQRAPSIYDSLVNKVTNLTYDGTAQELVTAGTTSHGTVVYSLTGNNDYTSTIPKATDAGNYTVYYKIQGDANHEDSEVGSVSASIGKANLEGAVITLGDALTYNGESQTQSIASVTLGTMTLGAGDYTVSDNTKSDAGIYTLTVTGQGNFEGNATKNFNIAKASAILVEDIIKKYAYTTGSKGSVVSIDIAGLLPADRGATTYTLAENTAAYVTDKAVRTDGTLTYEVGTNGTIGDSTTLTVTAASDNYEDITVNVKIQIVDKYSIVEMDDAKVAITGSNTLTYGQMLSALALNTSEAKFVEKENPTKEVTGTLAWETPNTIPNVETTTAKWVFTPYDASYVTVEGYVAIMVNKATPDVNVLPTVAGRTYDPNVSLTDTDLVGGTVFGVDGNSLVGEWSWQTPGIPTVNNTGYVAVFTPADTSNYNTVTRTITVNVSKATPYIAVEPTAGEITYGDTLGDSAISGGTVQYSGSDATTVAGSFAWADSSVKPSVSDSNTTTYQVVFNPSDTDNYNTVESDITLTVNKAGNTPNMPSDTMNVANSCEKVSDVTLPNGWVWQDADQNTALVVDTPVTATAEYNGADKGNYENETVSVTITRSACEHAHTEIRDEKASSCTETGYTGDTYCLDCGELLTAGSVIPLEDHQGGTATCTNKAVCTVCGQEYGALDANNHVHTEIRGTADASCTETGYTGDTYCTDCGVKLMSGTATDALGHNYTDKVTTEPTTEKEGVRTYTCDRCGHSYTESIPKLPDNRKPYIKDDTGKEGWDVIKDEIDKTKDGDKVVVDMNGSSVVPGDVIDKIKGKDITVEFDMGNGITWSVNGKSVTGEKTGDIDFSVTVGTNTIPVDVINNVTGERYSLQISLGYEGEFGFTAVLSINMDKKNAGLYANLFYYNEKTGELEFICADEIAEDGTTELAFTHASDYTIVIDKAPMDGSGITDNKDDAPMDGSDTTDNKNDTPDTGDRTPVVWLFVLVVLSVTGLVLAVKKGRINIKALRK